MTKAVKTASTKSPKDAIMAPRKYPKMAPALRIDTYLTVIKFEIENLIHGNDAICAIGDSLDGGAAVTWATDKLDAAIQDLKTNIFELEAEIHEMVPDVRDEAKRMTRVRNGLSE